MLQLYKNELITSFCQKHVELRQLELEWYTSNFWTLSQQAALLAGFAFAQLCTPVSEAARPEIRCAYLVLTAAALGLQLCVLVSSTFSCVWGPGLALRGPDGSASVHRAIDNLREEQQFAFKLFTSGLGCFLVATILLTWTYYVEWVAALNCFILGGFGVAVAWCLCVTTAELRLPDSHAVTGRIHAMQRYEKVIDLDAMVSSSAQEQESLYVDHQTESIAIPT